MASAESAGRGVTISWCPVDTGASGGGTDALATATRRGCPGQAWPPPMVRRPRGPVSAGAHILGRGAGAGPAAAQEVFAGSPPGGALRGLYGVWRLQPLEQQESKSYGSRE